MKMGIDWNLSSGIFGRTTSMMNVGLTAVPGSFSSLYQLGGPRSIQFALKLMF